MRRLHHHVRTKTAPLLQRTHACLSKLIPSSCAQPGVRLSDLRARSAA